jgi:DNA ligase-1
MIKLMLASKAPNLNELDYPLLVSPKLDGIRAYVNVEGKLVTRNGKYVPNQYVVDMLKDTGCVGLDGELIIGDPTEPDVFRNTTSAVMSKDSKDIGGITFHVFDYVPSLRDKPAHVPYGQRFRDLENLAPYFPKSLDHPLVKLVPHEQVNSVDELLMWEETWLASGYEGLMINSLSGIYKFGRSTAKEGYLLKLKQFCESEARIMGFVEEWQNNNPPKRNAVGKLERSSKAEGKVHKGVLGALQVTDIHSGVAFEVGTGFTLRERVEYWHDRDKYLGRTITYKYFPTGAKERPRFPVYKGLREDI